MEWIKVDQDHLPKGEVLVVNSDREFLVGFVGTYRGTVVCESDDGCLLYVPTHYIQLETLWEDFSSKNVGVKF